VYPAGPPPITIKSRTSLIDSSLIKLSDVLNDPGRIDVPGQA
jgi:hypothetical protein